ncbi:7451_t:CDS:1, partial [Dentiscutata erythropus]
SFIKYKDQKIRIRRIMAIVSTSNGNKLKVQLLYFGSELPRAFT